MNIILFAVSVTIFMVVTPLAVISVRRDLARSAAGEAETVMGMML